MSSTKTLYFIYRLSPVHNTYVIISNKEPEGISHVNCKVRPSLITELSKVTTAPFVLLVMIVMFSIPFIVTVNVSLALFPAESMAVHVTIVLPKSKFEPLLVLQETVNCLFDASVALAE